MNREIARKLLKKVKDDYNKIAVEFGATRDKLWPEFYFLKKYLKNGDKVLDLGCGNGRLYELFKELSSQDKNIKYIGIDISENLIKEAKKRYPEAEFYTGDALNLDFPEKEFDIVFFMAAFQHIPGEELRLQVLDNIKKILKPGGYLIMSNWNLWQRQYLPLFFKYSLKKIFKPKEEIVSGIEAGRFDFGDVLVFWRGETKRYYHAFRKKELKKLLKQAGFKIIFNNYSSKLDITLKNKNIITIAQK